MRASRRLASATAFARAASSAMRLARACSSAMASETGFGGAGGGAGAGAGGTGGCWRLSASGVGVITGGEVLLACWAEALIRASMASRDRPSGLEGAGDGV